MRAITLVFAVAVASFADGAYAFNISISNPGFALDVIAPSASPLNAYNGAVVNWVDAGGGVLSTNPALSGSFASVLADAPGDPDHQNAWSNGGTISQVLTTNLQALTTYTLTADIGDRTDTGTFPGGALHLGYGSTVGANLLSGTVVSNATPASGGWSVWTSTFVTGASPAGLGQPLRIDLVTSGVQMQLDNIQLSAVPEPSTLILGGLGLVGLFVAVRRRKI